MKQKLFDDDGISKIKQMLRKKRRMKLLLGVCASCGFCADSCFLYRKHGKPEYMPSYKAIKSLGVLFKKKGDINVKIAMEMKNLLYNNCVLCGRCYCPMGIDISRMISWARTILRSQGIYERYDLGSTGAKDEMQF
ncbi:MAG: 4Fe-4S dicluster domain-containing protein [Spirochaetes bacterium]|nr:4Fe-4S dicluster domain-containing protein [Spirochaetota bacterium]